MATGTGTNVSKENLYAVVGPNYDLFVSKENAYAVIQGGARGPETLAAALTAVANFEQLGTSGTDSLVAALTETASFKQLGTKGTDTLAAALSTTASMTISGGGPSGRKANRMIYNLC